MVVVKYVSEEIVIKSWFHELPLNSSTSVILSPTFISSENANIEVDIIESSLDFFVKEDTYIASYFLKDSFNSTTLEFDDLPSNFIFLINVSDGWDWISSILSFVCVKSLLLLLLLL